MNARTDISTLAPSLKGQCSAEEWSVRTQLAAAYRLVALFKWDDLIFTHISARIPGTEHFLINPYGLMFEEVTASNLIKIDLEGRILQDSPYPINPAGFVIHSAIHEARHDVQCVVHTHTLNGVGVAAQCNGLLPISQYSIFILSSLAYHDYEGVALRDDEKPRLVADLGDKSYLMLRNHGLLTVGASVEEAWLGMYTFEAACAMQIRAQGAGTRLGSDLVEVRPQIIASAAQQSRDVSLKRAGGPAALTWPGLLRRLDRIDPSFRD